MSLTFFFPVLSCPADEDATGSAIQKSGIARKDLFVTSKLWNSFHGDNVEMVSRKLGERRNPFCILELTVHDGFIQGLDATLRDLGTDYLDLYLMHWPVAFANPKNSELASLKSQDGRPIENHILSQDLIQTWQNLEKMVEKGKVRNIGISNFNIRRVETLLSEANIKPVVNQVEVNWGVPNDELLHYCEAHQVKIQAYSPLGSSDYVEEYTQDPVVVDVAKRNNITPAQALLAWHIGRGINPITRSRKPERLTELLEAAQIELPYPDVHHLLKEAENKPIQRVVDPKEAWNVKEDIFEDGVDQTRLMSLKTDSLEVPLPHEHVSSGTSPYLEPRNDPKAELKPTEQVARFHTIAGNRASLPTSRGSTIMQRLMKQRAFSSSPRASASPSSSSSARASSFLSGTSKQALATPGLKFADGRSAESRETSKMNMCTVRSGGGSMVQTRSASSVASRSSASSSSSSTPSSSLASAALPLEAVASALSPISSPPTRLRTERVYPPRKRFLFQQYLRLLNSSQFILVMQHNNLTSVENSRLRTELAAIPLPEDVDSQDRATYKVIRAGIMKPVLRQSIEEAQGTKNGLKPLEPLLSGPLAVLTSPTLSPPYISRLMSVIDKAFGNKAPPAAAPGTAHSKTGSVNNRLVPLAAIIEGNKVLDVPALRDVSTIPDLDTLRAQIVGLLSSPASQLAGVLSMASGGKLALTLEGRKQQLEAAQKSEQPS